MRNPGGKQFPQEHCVCFRKGKAESKICRETSAEARPFREKARPWSPKESPSSSGPAVAQKLGVGKPQSPLDVSITFLYDLSNQRPSCGYDTLGRGKRGGEGGDTLKEKL